MILWCWDDDERMWEARELPAGAKTRIADDAIVISLPGGRALLFARGAVWVNGLPALTVHALVHQDEIRAANRAFVLSAESRHEPRPLPPGRAGMCCARCKAGLQAGEPVVICSNCDSPHHVDCFTFDPRCASCPAPTTGALTVPRSVS